MRKHSVRKWIHAICDLLPLLVIPIFALAVRSDNNFTPIEVDQEINEAVVFNQNIDVSDINRTSGGLQFTSVNSYSLSISGERTGYISLRLNDYNLIGGHKYLYKTNLSDYTTLYYMSNFSTVTNFSSGVIKSYPSDVTGYFSIESSVDLSNGTFSFNFYDLTLMFGTGNEPTAIQFNDWYTNYYNYDIGTKELLHTGTYQTFNDTDVGSQMVYSLYQTTDKYFNFNNVGVFQDLYNWFETNMFNGTAPMSFYIVWNVILFEFIMDLIFLTYMVFMFIIDFAECMIDRFFEKSYRGGR